VINLHDKRSIVKNFEARILNLGPEGKTFDLRLTEHLHATHNQAKILKSSEFSITQNCGMLHALLARHDQTHCSLTEHSRGNLTTGRSTESSPLWPFAPTPAPPSSVYVSRDQTQALHLWSFTWTRVQSASRARPSLRTADRTLLLSPVAAKAAFGHLKTAPPSLKLCHPCSNVSTTKCFTLCTYVSIFSQNIFKGVSIH
jgi:hypothetical protein